ncbi:MAG: diguanylate cyclase [Sulfurospirillaceae bacterium]|nr:diguanylate cyclase [Sulfurospirillaceae bacterium]
MKSISKIFVVFLFSTLFLFASSSFSEKKIDYNDLFQNHGSIMLVIEPNGGLIKHANKAALSFYGYSLDEITSMHIQDINILSHEKVENERQEALEQGKNHFIFKHKIKSGEIKTVDVYSYPILSDGKTFLFSIIQDITSQKQLEEQLEQRKRLFFIVLIAFVLAQFLAIYLLFSKTSELRKARKSLQKSNDEIRALLENMQEGFASHEIICDDLGKAIDYRFLYVNRAFEDFTGLKKEDIVYRRALEVLPKLEKHWIKTYGEVALGGEARMIENFSQDIGKYFLVKVFSPEKNRFATIFFDISEIKNQHKAIEKLSYYDALTGLHNRRFFEEQVKKMDCKRNLPLSVVMFDVNGLKLTNDAFGHMEGDVLLKAFADVLKSTCREDDNVSRWGGDEFMVLLPKSSQKDAEAFCLRVLEKSTKKHNLKIQMSIACGCATKVDIKQNIGDLFVAAEEKMYEDKLLKGNAFKQALIDQMVEDIDNIGYRKRGLKDLAEPIANAYGIEEIEKFKDILSYYDVGNIVIDKSILTKKRKLTKDDIQKVSKHCETGYNILRSVARLAYIAEISLTHHERHDGNGYPRGLKGADIPFLSKVLSVVDAYDAMVGKRVYAKSKSTQDALDELKNCAGKQFNPDVVKIFIDKKLYELWSVA